jgi:hypothetical protein
LARVFAPPPVVLPRPFVAGFVLPKTVVSTSVLLLGPAPGTTAPRIPRAVVFPPELPVYWSCQISWEIVGRCEGTNNDRDFSMRGNEWRSYKSCENDIDEHFEGSISRPGLNGISLVVKSVELRLKRVQKTDNRVERIEI